MDGPAIRPVSKECLLNDACGSSLDEVSTSSCKAKGQLDGPAIRPASKECLLNDACGVSLSIPVKVNGVEVPAAIVDSAAQITIISTDLYHSLPNPPEVLHTVFLRGISNTQGRVKAHKLKDLNITIGNQIFPWTVYVAPITDQFLLGLDFLLHKSCQIDMKSGTVQIGSETESIFDAQWKTSYLSGC